jgi:hypothetical protein
LGAFRRVQMADSVTCDQHSEPDRRVGSWPKKIWEAVRFVTGLCRGGGLMYSDTPGSGGTTDRKPVALLKLLGSISVLCVPGSMSVASPLEVEHPF